MTVDGFFTRLNPLIVGILRSPVHWLLSPGLMLLTVTGRRSGRRYTIPVGYQRDADGITVMISEARSKSWWRNYHDPGPVELRVRGRVRNGTAVLVAPGSDEFRERAELTLRRMPWMGRVFRVAYDKRAGLSDAQVKALGDEIAVVRIRLEPSGA
jgi:deazaflavin-dependent oxidoreductase (nitroreductase family)